MELNTLLDRLKLDYLEAQLDAVCEQGAAQGLDYKHFLTQALDVEWRGRSQRGTEARLRLARFPWLKTLEQFDFDFQPSLDRRVVRELAGLSFVERAHNVTPAPTAGAVSCWARPGWARPISRLRSGSRRWKPATRCCS